MISNDMPFPGGADPADAWPNRPRRSLYFIRLGLLAVLLTGFVWMGWTNYRDRRVATSIEALPKDGQPAFLATQYGSHEISGNVPLSQRLLIGYREFLLRHSGRGRSPAAVSFPPLAEQLCDVYSLLNQCMQLTGTRYLLAREAVGRPVRFGYATTLNGAQWLSAAEQTLQKSGLVLIHETPKRVKVIPKEVTEAYREAGLVAAQQ